MKKNLIIAFVLLAGSASYAQKNKQQYPTPEFSNEIYFFIKDSAQVSRLEKGLSKMESKSKMAGMGGGESGYTLEGSHSPVRLAMAKDLSFILYTGAGSEPRSDARSDSMMRANGIDPSSMGEAMAMFSDPSRTTALYKMNVDKSERTITLQSYQGMKILGKSKKESPQYTLSFKKVRNGYYEMVVDKPLPAGEYAFVINGGMGGSMDGSSKLFAFGID